MDEPVSPAGQYEFGVAESNVVGKTATWVSRWAWIAIIGGVLMVLGGVVSLGRGGLAQLVMGGVYILVGAYFRGAGTSLSQVVRTTGNDVSHLMDALDRLASAFQVQVILVLVAVAVSFIAGLLMAFR